jgi:hypothetical protein
MYSHIFLSNVTVNQHNVEGIGLSYSVNVKIRFGV